MPLTLTWQEIATRLALTCVAGFVIGFNRGERGRPAGLRTTLLVCLAASFSMLLANLLLDTNGRRADSFVSFDVMRLPLGVLSGMGFLGAGAILRKGNMVVGLTTAATLWYVTLMGLCFGAGDIGLGLAALGLGCAILWGLKAVERFMHQEVRGELSLTLVDGAPADDRLREALAQSGCKVFSWAVSHSRNPAYHSVHCQIGWRQRQFDPSPPPIVAALLAEPYISSLQWQPQGVAAGSEAPG